MSESRRVRRIKEATPRTDTVWVSISRKVNVAKYESLDVSVGSSVEVEPGETVSEAIRRVGAIVREEHADILEVVTEDNS